MFRFLFIAAQNQVISGGSELLWSRVAVALAAQGHLVVASVPPGGSLPGDASKGVRVCARRQMPTGVPARLLSKLSRASLDTRMASFQAVIRETKPDLIIINQPGFTEGFDCAELASKLSIPYVLLVHNIHRWAWLPPHFAQRVADAYGTSQRIDLLSDNAEQDLADVLNQTFERVTRFRNPYGVDYELSSAFPALDAEVYIAMVGRLDPQQKGHDLALRLLAHSSWRVRRVIFNVYGDGDYLGFLQKMSVRLGVADKVVFHGHVNDVPSIWAHNHALLMPSRYEGLPIAMVEAMLSARPVIATDVGGISEWIDDGENGFLIPAPTQELVAMTLEAAWARRGDWQLLGERARVTALGLTAADPVAEYAAGLCALAKSNR
ncbi:MAG: glycosyltransferase family 1 protein [Puniceicoccaceae bacterium]|nr:MAG: glycosyltransferase family 1 protein [Puniceicoccaceae bacterium]